jgi:hypothetical protein
MTYFPPDTQNGTIDPFLITSDSTCGGEYEYMRRYTTLNDPTDIGNVIINNLYISDWLTVGDCQPNQTTPLPFIEPLSQILRPRNQLNLKRGFYVQDTVGIGLTTDEKVDRTTQLYIDTTYNPNAILALKVIGDVSVDGAFLLGGSDIGELLDQIQEDITTIQGDITTIQGDITTIQGDITTIQGDISSLDQRITDLGG